MVITDNSHNHNHQSTTRAPWNTSPKSVAEPSPLLDDDVKHLNLLLDTPHQQHDASNSSCSLEELIAQLPTALSEQKAQGIPPGSDGDEVFQLMSRVQVDYPDVSRYAHADPSRHYTRNLISTDGTSYTLLLLCWNPHRSSPIHDHPCDGCWMKVLQGQVFESRYRDVTNENAGINPNNNNHTATTPGLECTHHEVYSQGQVAFINDSMGYHKVGNQDTTHLSMTLHLYAPPFQQCRTWLDPNNSQKSSRSKMCFYSAYGKVL